MPLPFDPTDPVMAAFHATVVQGGYSTPAIEADRMKIDVRRIDDIDLLVVLCERAGLGTGDRTIESLQRRMCDRIDERLAAYVASDAQAWG